MNEVKTEAKFIFSSKQSLTFLVEASPEPKMNFSKRNVEKIEKLI